ncbi:unnamed protein product [Gadus morhua 'NCC']
MFAPDNWNSTSGPHPSSPKTHPLTPGGVKSRGVNMVGNWVDTCCDEGSIRTMMYVSRLVLLLGLLLCLGVQLSTAQHWSHGWYPGGKRELEAFTTSEVSDEIKLCEAGECSYLRPQHRGTLRNIFMDVLARELQKRK